MLKNSSSFSSKRQKERSFLEFDSSFIAFLTPLKKVAPSSKKTIVLLYSVMSKVKGCEINWRFNNERNSMVCLLRRQLRHWLLKQDQDFLNNKHYKWYIKFIFEILYKNTHNKSCPIPSTHFDLCWHGIFKTLSKQHT